MTGEELRKIRLKLGLNTQQMCEFLGLSSRRLVQRYESGENRVPKTVIKILELKKLIPS